MAYIRIQMERRRQEAILRLLLGEGMNWVSRPVLTAAVYVYKHSDRPVTQRFIDETIEKYKKRVDSDGKRVYHSDIEAHLAALDQLAKEYGLYYEKR